MKQKKSFTIIEIIVAATLMVAFSLLLVAGLTQNYEAFQTNNIINTFQNDARLSIFKIRKDLRRTAWTRITITKNTPSAGTDQLTYYLPQVDGSADPILSGNAVLWDTNPVTITVNNGDLIRTDISGATVLAKNVKAVTFFDINQDSLLYIDELKFAIEFQTNGFAGRVHNYKTTAVVNMRN